MLVVDESFIDFADEQGIPSAAALPAAFPNLLILKSLGKNFGLHGVRLGYSLSSPEVAARLRLALPRWNLNALAELLIRELGAHLDAYEESRRRVVRDRQLLEAQLRELEALRVFPSHANFVYFRVPDRIDGPALRDWLLGEHGLMTRECSSKVGSDGAHFRVASRPPAESALLIEALAQRVLSDQTPPQLHPADNTAAQPMSSPLASHMCTETLCGGDHARARVRGIAFMSRRLRRVGAADLVGGVRADRRRFHAAGDRVSWQRARNWGMTHLQWHMDATLGSG